MTNNNKKLVPTMSVLALATAASLTMGAATAANLQEVEEKQYTGKHADFAEWKAKQRQLILEDQTDQFIIEYLENVDTKKEAKKLAKRLRKMLKKSGVKHKGKLKNKKHIFKLAQKLAVKSVKPFLI
ncbi:hypothetical protein [Psychrosphaera haliotis]|uniref:Uncharacterized protein n=1 Tax=Psychrosphaera haliotis TaxID=555083 RepID=A0A6N8F9V2_9GAMM|nr:hypothetical protein [Psychrosphaera haliotis]MUH71572.1 hypothetical protein [Psychrosphaera haliotis]